MGNRGIAGARARLYMDGAAVGWATGVSAQENIALQAIEVLGEIDVVEHEPLGRTVSFNADYIRIKGKDLQAMGIWPVGETAEAILDFRDHEMVAEVVDVVTNKPIYKLEGVMPETRSWRVDKGGVMTTNASFRARLMHSDPA